MSTEMTGAELICSILKAEGVKYVFGVPGNSEVPLLDALAQTQDIKYISAIHESVSMGMADGYARASGNVGVVLVHTTPGTANIIGNLTNAYDAGTPLVVIAGQQDSRLKWCDPLLDSDLLPMVSQHTKDRWWVSRGEDIARGSGTRFQRGFYSTNRSSISSNSTGRASSDFNYRASPSSTSPNPHVHQARQGIFEESSATTG